MKNLLRWFRRLSAVQTILVALILIALIFVGWISVIRYFWAAYPPVSGRSEFWTVAEGLSSAASFAAVIGGGILVLSQLVESVDSRHLGIYDEAFKRMMSRDETEARRWIMQELPSNPLDPQAVFRNLSPEQHWHIKRVLNSFDHLGFLLEQAWITDDAIIGWVSPMVVKVWAKLGPYVEHESRRRNEPDYYRAARYLAAECEKWRVGNEPDSAVTFVDDAL